MTGLMTMAQARAYLAVSKTTMWELVQAGHFRVFSYRGLRRVYAEDVVAFRDAHTQKVA